MFFVGQSVPRGQIILSPPRSTSDLTAAVLEKCSHKPALVAAPVPRDICLHWLRDDLTSHLLPAQTMLSFTISTSCLSGTRVGHLQPAPTPLETLLHRQQLPLWMSVLIELKSSAENLIAAGATRQLLSCPPSGKKCTRQWWHWVPLCKSGGATTSFKSLV